MSKPAVALEQDPVLAAFDNAPVDEEVISDDEIAELDERMARGALGSAISAEVLERLRFPK